MRERKRVCNFAGVININGYSEGEVCERTQKFERGFVQGQKFGKVGMQVCLGMEGTEVGRLVS